MTSFPKLAMDNRCNSCGSNDFVTENYEKVCTNCGDIQQDSLDDGNLCMLPDNEAIEDNFRNKNKESNLRLTGRIRGETNDATTRKKITRDNQLDEMKLVVKQLLKHPGAVEETMELVKSTYGAFDGRLFATKRQGIVGACIYYLSAKHQLGIRLSDICKVMGIKMKVISVCLKQVKQLCPDFEYDRPNIKDLVKKIIDDLTTKTCDLASLDDVTKQRQQSSPQTITTTLQPLIESKDRIMLENRVMLLIDLFEAMHPYNQPSPYSLVIAVIYHAWRSFDTFKVLAVNLASHPVADGDNISPDDNTPGKAVKIKHAISFERFCQICDLKRSSNGYKIVTKLQTSLLQLGRFLGDVNKINLPWYLKDIIENSPHLLQAHQQSEPTK